MIKRERIWNLIKLYPKHPKRKKKLLDKKQHENLTCNREKIQSVETDSEMTGTKE